MSKCLNCNKENPPPKAHKERKYCSKGCSNEYYKKTARYKKDPWVRKYQVKKEDQRQRKEKYEELLKTHMTSNQISQKLGIEPSSVFHRAKVLGITPLRHTYQTRRDHYSAEQVEKIVNFQSLRSPTTPIGYIDRKELLSELQIHWTTLREWFEKFGKIPNTITAHDTSNPNKEFYDKKAIQQWLRDIEKSRQAAAAAKQAEKLAREKTIESERVAKEREFKRKTKGLVNRKEAAEMLGYKSFTESMQKLLLEHEVVLVPPYKGKRYYYPEKDVKKAKKVLEQERALREHNKKMRRDQRYPKLGISQTLLYEERAIKTIMAKYRLGKLKSLALMHYPAFLNQVNRLSAGEKISKVCKDCKIEKDITEYFWDMTYSECRRHSCKSCDAIRREPNVQPDDRKMKFKATFLTTIKKSLAYHIGQHYYISTLEAWEKIEKECGYTWEDLVEHVESQFEDWMSWQNWGRLPKDKSRGVTWQIDHVLPKAMFVYRDFSDEDFKKCWALENLQVLDSVENSLKSRTTDLEHISSRINA